MHDQSRLPRNTAALGIVFAALFFVGDSLSGGGGSTPESDSAAQVMRYYTTHHNSQLASVFVVAIATVALIFFLGSVRRAVASAPDNRILASVITAGGAVLAVGLLLFDFVTLGLLDSAHSGSGAAAQTFNIMSNDDWVIAVVGICMVGLGTGIAAIRSRGLPRWLAWVSVVLGLVAVSGPAGAVAFLALPVWSAIISIVLLRDRTDTVDDLPLEVSASR